MKPTILLALLFSAQFCFGQLEIKEKKENTEIGEISMASTWLMSLELSADSSAYIFMYRNLKYQSTIDVKHFLIDSSDIDVFYNTLINNLNLVDKKELEMPLADGDILTLTFWKKKVQFTVWNGSFLSYSQYFKRKQIDKLFGKI